MSKTSTHAVTEPGRLRCDTVALAIVIATNLANAHSTGQYLAGLAFALAHDTLIHRR